MKILFEIIKVVFVTLTIVVAILFSGGWGMTPSLVGSLKQMILPGYLFLSGLMIGYILTQLLGYGDEENRLSTWMRGLGVGTLVGFSFALIYVIS